MTSSNAPSKHPVGKTDSTTALSTLVIRRYVKKLSICNRATHRLPNVVCFGICDGWLSSYLSSQAYDGSFEGFGDSDTLITLATDTAFGGTKCHGGGREFGLCHLSDWRFAYDCNDLIELLQLPKYTYPIFGLCIGKPAVEMRVKTAFTKICGVF